MAMMVLLVTVLARSAAAVDLDVYLTAARSGVAGEVAGRAYEERRRLDLPERPLPDTTVTLLPRSDAVVRRLEDLKRGARDSHEVFRLAVPRMLEAQQEHERAVRTAGGESLVFTVAAGADGIFTIPGVPAGEWILIARQESLVPNTGHEGTKKDRETYQVGPRLAAYRAVRLWVREVTMAGGAVADVALTDRNVWFSGVVEVQAGRR